MADNEIIAIFDDNPISIFGLRTLLETYGFVVAGVAKSVAEARKLVLSDAIFTLAMIDVRMPKPEDGKSVNDLLAKT